MPELPLEQMLGRQPCDFLCIGTQFRKLGERIVRPLLFVGQAQSDRRNTGFDDRLGDPLIRNPGDDPCAAPLLHFWHSLLEITWRDVKAPGAVDSGVARNPVQQIAAETARGLHQQGDSRNVPHETSRTYDKEKNQSLRLYNTI